MAKASWFRGIRVLILMFILAGSLIIGSIYVYNSGKGDIGIIAIRGYILTEQDRNLVVRMINYAINNDSIKAVVVEIDSGGGWVSPVEEIYYHLLKLGETKPVVASITGMAASGGFYIAVSAEKIFSLPSSDIGNVGVIGFIPSKDTYLHDESMIATGPYKTRGTSERTFPLMMQNLLSGFLRAITIGRGERLKVSEKELAMGRVYTGREALELGLIDELGSTMQAVESAAAIAGLRSFRTIDLMSIVSPSGGSLSGFISGSPKVGLYELRQLNQSPHMYYVYADWSTEASDWPLLKVDYTSWPSSDGGYSILFDEAHLNAYSKDEMTPLLAELISQGNKVDFLEDPGALDAKLGKAKALVAISPRKTYTEGEIASIRDFVESGGKVLLIMDPTRTYAEYVNPLAAEFGIFYAGGYLYDVDANYGNYRYIIGEPAVENNITRDIRKLVFYTATMIYPQRLGIILTPNSTYWSESEMSGEYPVIVVLPEKGVMAIGDQTFLTEPYVTSEDNAKFVTNIVEFLTSP